MRSNETLFDPPGVKVIDAGNRHSDYMRIPLNSPPCQWLSRGYTRDVHGFTKYGYCREPSPLMVPLAGHQSTSEYELIKVCRMVARAALCTDPAVSLDWACVADWLEAGARPQDICDAISTQVRRMGNDYHGVHTLKLFNNSVRVAIEKERTPTNQRWD